MLVRQTLLYLPAQILGPVFQLVSAFAWTHFLAPDEMGSFALVSAAQELAFTLLLGWFAVYTVRYFDTSAPESEKARFYDTEASVLAVSSALMMVALASIPLDQRGTLSGALLWSSLAFVVTRSLAAYLADRVRTEADTLSYTVLQTGGPVGGFFLGLVLVYVLPATASTVLLAYAIAQAASLAYAVTRLRLGLRPDRGSAAIVRAAIGYGLPLFFAGLLVWVANNAVRFLIEWKEGLAAVGLATVGWALGLRAAQFASMLTTAAAFPLAVKRYREEGAAAGQTQLVANGVLLIATLAPAAAGLYAIGEPFVALMIAEPYRAITASILPMALLTGALRNLRVHFVNQVFLLHGRPTTPTLNDGLDALATVVFGAIGLHLNGIEGAIAGALVASVMTFLTGLAIAWRYYRFALPLGDLVMIGLSTLLMALGVLTLGTQPTAGSLAYAMMTGAVIYAGLIGYFYPTLAEKFGQGLIRLAEKGRAALEARRAAISADASTTGQP